MALDIPTNYLRFARQYSGDGGIDRVLQQWFIHFDAEPLKDEFTGPGSSYGRWKDVPVEDDLW